MKRAVCVLSLLVLTSAVAQASSISLIANRDNFLMGAGGANLTEMNYGASVDLSIGRANGIFDTLTGLLSFDVSSVPVGTTVETLKLRLHSSSWVDSAAVGALTINVNAMLASNKDWVEGTGITDVGAKLVGSCFDWKNASGTVEEPSYVNWASMGQFGSSDYDATVLSTRSVSAADVGKYVDFTIAGTPTQLTSLIDGWRTDNAGLVLSSPSTAGVILMRFGTRELGTAAYAPQLVINEVPEPSSCVLVAVGVIGLLAYAWRKRR
jgi:hypothetical protein